VAFNRTSRNRFRIEETARRCRHQRQHRHPA